MARANFRALASGILVILVAAAFVTMMIPSANLGQKDLEASIDSGPGDRTFTIGVPDMYVDTLNPLFYTGSAEYMTIWPCYSTLLMYDVDASIIGDLADSWSMTDSGQVWTFNLVNNAVFYDPANPGTTHPVTAADVIFTFGLIQNNINSLQYHLPDGIISSMTAEGSFTLTIELSRAYAPFLSSMASIPILPEYIWSGQSVDWPNFDIGTGIWPCIGSGPMYYAQSGIPVSNVELRPNPAWFQTVNRGWQIHPDRVVYKWETVDGASSDLMNGVIDVFQNVPPSVYQGFQPLPSGIQGFAQTTGFVYEFNLNQLSLENREFYDIGAPDSYNNQLLLDPVVKLALAMSVDKNTFVEYVLKGLGSVADSLIPDVSPWHYTYGSIPGEEPISFDTFGARMLLYVNGWVYRLDGTQIGPSDPDYTTYYPLSRSAGVGVTDTLQFRFYVPDFASEYLEGGLMIEQWAASAGVDLMLEAVSIAQMSTAWYSADYDVWLWDWIFAPLSDPSTEIMSVLTSMEIGSWSDVFYSDPVYDDLWLQSLSETDPATRKLIIDELQRMAYQDMGCQCVAYGKSLYLVSSNTADHWTNYGDWETQFLLMPEFALPYLYMRVVPADNPAPLITGWLSSYETILTLPISFSASAVDTDLLQYRWNFGDGTSTDWSSSPYASHLYLEDGVYTAYMMVREQSSIDQFMSWASAKVVVRDPLNDAPSQLSFVYYPTIPYAGESILFTGEAYDPEGDYLYFSWDFGDGATASGATVSHAYAEAGSYVVTMYVDDGHIGTTTRPVYTSRMVTVAANSAPVLFVPDFSDVLKKTTYTFEVTASDPDGDALLYTWYWGDGTSSVSATNQCDHIYEKKGTYTLTVIVSDQTGIPGHEVTDTGTVVVTWVPFKGPH